jgi:hypothetical protein
MKIDEIIKCCSLSSEQTAEYREYISNRFAGCNENTSGNFDFLKNWHVIVGYAGEKSAAEAINRYVSAQSRTATFRLKKSVVMSRSGQKNQ